MLCFLLYAQTRDKMYLLFKINAALCPMTSKIEGIRDDNPLLVGAGGFSSNFPYGSKLNMSFLGMYTIHTTLVVLEIISEGSADG